MSDRSDSTSSHAQSQFELLYKAKRPYSDTDSVAYQNEIARIRKERDLAVESNLRSEIALQKVIQERAEERKSLEHEIQILKEKFQRVEAERAAAVKRATELEQARDTAERLRSQAVEQNDKLSTIDERLQSLTDNLSRFSKWTFDLAVAEGRASFDHSETEDAVGEGHPNFLAQFLATATPNTGSRSRGTRSLAGTPTPARPSSPLARPATTFQRVRGTPALKARTVSATFELGEPEVKEEEDDDPITPTPVKRKRDDQQQHTPRTTHEPATPLLRSVRPPRDEESASSDDELSIQRAKPSPRQPVRNTARPTARPRRTSGGSTSAARGTSKARRRAANDDNDEYVVDEDEEVERPRGKTAWTPFPAQKKARR